MTSEVKDRAARPVRQLVSLTLHSRRPCRRLIGDRPPGVIHYATSSGPATIFSQAYGSVIAAQSLPAEPVSGAGLGNGQDVAEEVLRQTHVDSGAPGLR